MKIQFYKSGPGRSRFSSMVFGLCNIGDGLVRAISFGFLFSSLALDHSRNSAKKQFDRIKREREAEDAKTKD